MKKRIVTAMVLICMSVFLLSGCGKKEDTAWKQNDSGTDMDWLWRDDEPTESPTEAPAFDFGNTLEADDTEDGSMEEAAAAQEATWIQFTHHIGESEPVESATVTGYDDAGQVVWTYETVDYDMTELERVVEIGVFEDRYYLLEGGSIVALRVSDGEVLWMNSEFCGASPSFDFLSNGTLCICGYDDGEIICNVIVGDYENYYFTDVYGNLVGKEIVPGVDPGDTDVPQWISLTPTQVCDQVVAYYNAYFGTTDFVAFDTEYTMTAEGAWVVLRTTGRADANVYVADVFVNMVTGEVTDPWGENWYLSY